MTNRPLTERELPKAAAAMPAALRITIAALSALVLLHVAVPVMLLAGRASLRDDTLAAHPDFRPDQLDAAVVVTLAAAAVFHLLFCAAYIWFGWKLARGRRWARIALTITLVLATLFSVVSWTSSSMFHAAIIASDVLQIVLMGLLWLPPSVRVYLARADRPPLRQA